MTALLNWRLWAALALAMALAASHWKAFVLGGNQVRVEWAQEKETNEIQARAALAQAATKTIALQIQADKTRKAKDAHIARLAADLDAALDSLRQRPDRPADLPAPASAGAATGCTGAELWRPDAGFLAREAARADRILADLGQCQAAYEQARGALN
jgi:hypothetical protein